MSGAVEETDTGEGGAGATTGLSTTEVLSAETEICADSAVAAGKTSEKAVAAGETGEKAAAAGLGGGECGGVAGSRAAEERGQDADTAGASKGEIRARRDGGRGEGSEVEEGERLAKGKTCSTKVTWPDT